MQVRLENVSSHLADTLANVYLVSGDETLLVEETCDAVIAKARTEGFTERSVHHVDGSFKWHELAQDGASLSLFAERKVIDVRVPANKFDKEGSAALREWVADPPPDNLLLLRTTRLQPRQRSAAWFKDLDKHGVVVLIWPVAPQQLPRWLGERMRLKGLQAEPDALQYLAERVEGNLLAAAQEIEKLGLMGVSSPISVDDLVTVLEDTTRFTPFDLIDAVMAGDGGRVTKVLAGLREEGASLYAVLGAFTSQLRRLGNTRGMPQERQRLVRQFQDRVRDIPLVLAECAVVDRQGKGQGLADAWVSLERLLLRLSGCRALTLPSEDDAVLSPHR
jgi:DNA polymerase-3 subunit delta